MRISTKENLIILAMAWASVLGLFGLLLTLDWAGLDWRKWGAFVFFTLVLFGYLLNKYGRDIRRLRCFLTLLGLFIVHVAVFAAVLRSVPRFSDFYYLFTMPLEAGVAGFVLVAIGGARTVNKRSHPHQ
jgi:hypothetical protein